MFLDLLKWSPSHSFEMKRAMPVEGIHSLWLYVIPLSPNLQLTRSVIICYLASKGKVAEEDK